MKPAALGLLLLGLVLAATHRAARVRTTAREPSSCSSLLGLVAVGVGVAAALRRAGTAFGLLLAGAGCLWFVSAVEHTGCRLGGAVHDRARRLGCLPGGERPMPRSAIRPVGSPARSDRIGVTTGYIVLVGLFGIAPALVFDPVAGSCRACPNNLLQLGRAPAIVEELHRGGAVCAAVMTAGAGRAVRRADRPVVACRPPGDRVGADLGSGVTARDDGPACPVRRSGDRSSRRRDPAAGCGTGDLAVRAGAGRRCRNGFGCGAPDPGWPAMHWISATRHPAATCATSSPVELAGSDAATGVPAGRRPTRRRIRRADNERRQRPRHHCPRQGRHAPWRCSPILTSFPMTTASSRTWCRPPGCPWTTNGLSAQARAQVAELAASQLRIIETGDAERKRLERDLHDGAQQRLVALMLTLRLARSTAKTAVDVERIDTAIMTLREVIAAVRGLAAGIYPSVLAEAGLRGGLAALGRGIAIPGAGAGGTGQEVSRSSGERCLPAGLYAGPPRRRHGLDRRRRKGAHPGD